MVLPSLQQGGKSVLFHKVVGIDNLKVSPGSKGKGRINGPAVPFILLMDGFHNARVLLLVL